VIEIAKITDGEGLFRLRAEWESLWQRDPAATPFQSPLWLLAWWRFFGTSDPLVLTAREGGELVAILPLYILKEAGCRKLLPIGVGLSDYIDALVDPAADAPVDLFIAAIAEMPGWDECWLPDLAPDAALVKAKAAGAPGLTDRFTGAPPCPVLPLSGNPARLDKMVPRKRLRDLNRLRRRAAGAGNVVIETIAGEGLDAAMDDLFRLHGRRWHTRGEAGLCSDPQTQGFHRMAARGLLAAGMLRLYRLSIEGAALAVCYGFAAKGSACAYLSGFDPSQLRLSPGRLIIGHAIEEASAERAMSFDFLRGDERYKYGWGAVDRSKTSRHLSRRCMG
jgi:CelD/BcsL family acetyltransferase involved in cellulose biosynthesis